jgi:DNA-binding MarR family transcriptional regulator
MLSPMDPEDEDCCSRLATAEALYRLMTTVLRQIPRDISLTAAATLSTVERAGPQRITDLAVTQGVTQPSMTVLVTALEKSGLVERRRDPSDQRVVLVALTEAGADYVRYRRQAGTQAFSTLIDKLPAGEIESLLAAAPALRHLRELGEQHQTAQDQAR